ncbi:hypothetical protein GCM10023083_29100 [Streptomyces phyllanthi]
MHPSAGRRGHGTVRAGIIARARQHETHKHPGPGAPPSVGGEGYDLAWGPARSRKVTCPCPPVPVPGKPCPPTAAPGE